MIVADIYQATCACFLTSERRSPDISHCFLHVMNANPSTYGAMLLGALFASGSVSHFLIDWDMGPST